MVSVGRVIGVTPLLVGMRYLKLGLPPDDCVGRLRPWWARLGSGSVRGYCQDEVGVEGHADPFQ